MSLSGILASVPKHQTTLPVSGKKVHYRPFVVKEEKILLMAAETKDEGTINSAVRDVVLACTNNEVDVYKIPITDMEYMFLQLRSHSVGEKSTPSLKCSNCEMATECEINLNEIKPKKDGKHTNKIHLTGDIHVLMRYPSFNDVQNLNQNEENDVQKTIDLLVRCIDKIYHGEKIYNTAEMDKSEVRDFVDEMTQEQFKKLFNFIDTMPRLEEKVSFKCKHCGQANEVVLKGMTSFF
jgi:hypothetical protein